MTSIKDKKAKGVRKSRKENIPKLLELIRGGAGLIEACNETNIAQKTFWRWRQADPKLEQQLCEAESSGTKEIKRKLINRLFEAAMEPTSGPQMKALQLFLQKLDPDFRPNITVNKSLNPKEYQEMIASLRYDPKNGNGKGNGKKPCQRLDTSQAEKRI